MSTATFSIPSGHMDWLETKLAKLNKEAEKLGCPPIAWATLASRDVKDDHGWVHKILDIQITGEAPKLSGWTFVAALTHAPTGNVIRTVPGESVPKRYYDAAPVCDYCKKDWIVRRDTYIVRNDEGEYRQVGSNCLSDFLGHPDPFRYAAFAESLASLQGEIETELQEHSNAPRFDFMDLETYLAQVAAVMDTEGWVSRKKAYEEGGQATADTALDHLRSRSLSSRDRIVPEKKHLAEAQQIIQFARTEIQPDNEYRQNLKVLASSDVFPHKEGAGFVASLVPYYRREQEKRLQVQQQTKLGATSQYVGEVGDRFYDQPMTIVSMNPIDGMYGPTIVTRMTDAHGNVYTWFAHGKTIMQLETGQTYEMSCTIKSHKEWQGRKETQLSRCTVSL